MPEMKIRLPIIVLSILYVFGCVQKAAESQLLAAEESTSTEATTAPSIRSVPSYQRPTHREMVGNYILDTYGPYPIVGAAAAAGINQLNNAPPEWKQGAEGYGKRFGSDFAMAAVGTTTRYAFSEVLKEDTLYYRCECRGVFPRVSHAVISTLTARRGEDGHRVFSISALVAPYAGATTAIYGWYPNRYGAKDALRLGSYDFLIHMGTNISLEFLYSAPRALLSRMHMRNMYRAPDPGPNQ